MTKIEWTPEGFAKALERAMVKLAPRVTSIERDAKEGLRVTLDECEYHCPLTFVATAEGAEGLRNEWRFDDAAAWLGCPADVKDRIVAGADGKRNRYRAPMRRVLNGWTVES